MASALDAYRGSSSQEQAQQRTRQSAPRASALEPLPPEFAIGSRVHVLEKFFGTIRYLGNTQFSSGMWVGVELDTADGKNDGSVSEVRYFACGPNMGLFARPHAVRLLDGASRGSLHVTIVPENPQHGASRGNLDVTTSHVDPKHTSASSGSGATRLETVQEPIVAYSLNEADLSRCKDDILRVHHDMERVGNILDNVPRTLDLQALTAQREAESERAENEWLAGATERLEQKLEALVQNLHQRSEILERIQSLLDQKLEVALKKLLPPKQDAQCSLDPKPGGGAPAMASSSTTTQEICIYPGFTEHAYRLVFPFEERFAPDAPHLLTVMPSGVVETTEILEPKKEDALIAFTYPQSISDELADSPVLYKADGSVNDSVLPQDSSRRIPILRDTAFVWRREDKTNALVQTWPTSLNEKFRKTFEITEGTNPDSDKFLPQAVSEFQAAMVQLFGPNAAKCPILFCHKKTVNTSPAVAGVGEEVLAHVKKDPELMRELAILSVDSGCLGFVADGTSGDGNKFEKHFTLTAGEQCVVYRKVGWESMGCIKPLHQFLRDSDLQEPAVSVGKGVCIHPGFTEHAYRLVFPFQERFAPAAPSLLTIVPSGVVETNKILEPKKEAALIAFTYPQSISDELADSPVSYKAGVSASVSEDSNRRILRDTAYVWRREDGTNALVQTWPTNLNDKFRKTFAITEGMNPDSNKFLPQAVSEFQAAMVQLFGPAADKCPILFCHKKTVNTSPAVVGVGEEVLAHVRKHPELMRELAILSVDSECLGFVADGTSGDGKKFEKHFTLTAGEQCVVYRKVGWESMGCIKPLHQFLHDAELQEPAEFIGKDSRRRSGRTMPNLDSPQGKGVREHDDRQRFDTAASMPDMDKVKTSEETGFGEQTSDMLHGHDQDCYRDYILRLWADRDRIDEDRRKSLKPLLPNFQHRVPMELGFFGDGENSEDEWVRLVGISVLCLDFNKNVREAYKGRLPGRANDTAEDHFLSIQVWWKREANGKLEQFLEGFEFVQALTRYRQKNISGFVAYRPRSVGLPPNDQHPRRDGHLHTFDRRSELLIIVQGSYLGAQDMAANASCWTVPFPSVLQALDIQMAVGHEELVEHKGYADIVKELFPQVMDAIIKINKPIDRIVVSGHSLGAAVGAGLLKVLHNHGKYDLQAFLFAQPRSFTGLTDEIRMNDRVLDIHNTFDPVVAASKLYKGLGAHVTFEGDDFTGEVQPKAYIEFEY